MGVGSAGPSALRANSNRDGAMNPPGNLRKSARAIAFQQQPGRWDLVVGRRFRMVCSRVAPDSATVATGVKQSPKIHITQIPSHYIHNALTQMRALNLLLHNRALQHARRTCPLLPCVLTRQALHGTPSPCVVSFCESTDRYFLSFSQDSPWSVTYLV